MRFLSTIFIVVLAFLTFVQTQHDDSVDPIFDKMVKDCATNFTIEHETAWDLIESERDASNDNEKCFATCVGEGLKILNTSDKKLNTAFLANPPMYLAKDKIAAALTKCGALTGTTACDTGYKQMDCLFEEAGVNID